MSATGAVGLLVGLAVGAAVLVLPLPQGGRRVLGPASAGSRTGGGGPARPHAVPVALRRARDRWVVSRGARDTTAGVVELVEVLAAQLRAGSAPALALRHAVEGMSGGVGTGSGRPTAAGSSGGVPDLARDLAGVAAVAATGGSVVERWRAVATRRDDAGLAAVAAAWALAESSGAPLAEVLERVAAQLRDEADVTAEVEASLAAPRATARLLAALPLLGLGLGELMGVHPLAVLTGTVPGRAAGAGGVLLTLVGHRWSQRMVAAVQASA